MYTSSSWCSGLFKTSQNRLQVLHNKIIKFVLNLPSWSWIDLDQYRMLDLSPVDYSIKYLRLNHMYKMSKSSAPSYNVQYVWKKIPLWY